VFARKRELITQKSPPTDTPTFPHTFNLISCRKIARFSSNLAFLVTSRRSINHRKFFTVKEEKKKEKKGEKNKT